LEIQAAADDLALDGATLIVGVMEGLVPVPGSEALVAMIDEAYFSTSRFEGKTGQLMKIPFGEGSTALVVGLGSEASFESIRSAVGSAVRAATTPEAIVYLALVPVAESVRAVAEGVLLGGYRFRDYKTDDQESPSVESVHIAGADDATLEYVRTTAAATNQVRDWVNTPAADKSPEAFASIIEREAPDVVSVEIWESDRIAAEHLGGLLGVAAGSNRPPRLVILEYRPEPATHHLGLVGKGIIFDTGGLSLKPAKSMETMKSDMAGAAAVVAATFAIARLEIPLAVTTVVPITDNAVGPDATRPGDILRPVAGPSVEVLNTDAEGRLILADGLGVARRFEPDLLVDVATLTGSAPVALGRSIAAVLGPDPAVTGLVLTAAARAGEHLWELPLFQPYMKDLESDVADIKNVTGSRFGGTITAGLFLSRYAGDGDWAHMDIAGPAMSTETNGEQVKGASGYGVRTLVELAKAMVETD
jgi:leucyl aminopeptidase